MFIAGVFEGQFVVLDTVLHTQNARITGYELLNTDLKTWYVGFEVKNIQFLIEYFLCRRNYQTI